MPMEHRYFTRKHYYCFWVLIHVVFMGVVVESCIEEERLGLLSMKDYVKLNIADKYPSFAEDFLSSWTDHDPESDCCSWEGVECKSTTSRVTQLSLDLHLGRPPMPLNMSLFTPFKDLFNLRLLEFTLINCSQNYDFKALENLVALDLSFSSLDSSILPCLSTLTSLRSLRLLNSFLEDLPIRELGSLQKLEILDLSLNELSGNVFHFLHNMTSLKVLSLAYNFLSGSLAQQGLCELKQLQELNLSENNLSGTIPPCLANLTSLRILDLSFNKLEGDILSSPIFNLKDLTHIDLRDNLFEGLFPFYSIANHTNLEVLMLSSPNHKLEVQTQYSHDWLPTFQLKVLSMPNCKFHSIPHFLAHQTDLRFVDLSHNNLTGTFPNWLLENNTKLEFLSLRNNSFTGQFHLSPNSSFVMHRIDISDNHFHGGLQQDIGHLFSTAELLNLSANDFEGRIPFSIGQMPKLIYLDLSSNRFLEDIATTLIGAANASNLRILAATDNKLYGQIPSSINMTQLMSLQLGGNQITGNLLSWISHNIRLGYLDISDNQISGELPSSIGNLTPFGGRRLNMAGNRLEGRIPCELARLKFFLLDLSYNFLSGPIPSCFNFSSLQHFNLEGNRLTGSIPKTLFNSSGLLTLNIGNNLLSGRIPSAVGALANLRVFLLGRNSLRGLIPDQLCQLNELSILDLSRNSFSGPIPRCFGNISFGKLPLSDFATPSLFYLTWKIGYNYDIGGNVTNIWEEHVMYARQLEVGFLTKTTTLKYKGSILNLMSGLDLSCNQLTGEIPIEFGNLSGIRALNLSHNQFTGFIPETFVNLGMIESLDLSHNNLSGGIPSELIDLTFLSYFSVAYNNLSGRLPDMNKQFQTFDNKSYEGNPFLCGPPLVRSCIQGIPQLTPSNTDAGQGKWYDIDPISFTASFIATYLVFLLCFALVFYINLGWRRRLFMFIDYLMDECYFLAFYTVPKLFAKLYR